MELIRPTAVAGLFYPARADELTEMIEADIRLAQTHPHDFTPKALIVPHAGYIYSGQIAAEAYRYLLPIRDKIKRVVLIGPSHRVPFNGLALTEADWHETPLGLIPVDRHANSQLIELAGVQVLEAAHAHEHCLEVQLPFLQYLLSNFNIVPIVAGKASAELIADALDLVAADDDTLIVISSDLSHYLDYESAKMTDSETSEAILSLDPAHIDSFHACGCVGIKGFLRYAQKHALKAEMLLMKNSGDTAGKKDSVVGYGAYLFH